MDIVEQLKAGYTEKDCPRAPTALNIRAAKHIKQLQDTINGLNYALDHCYKTIGEYEVITNTMQTNVERLTKELEDERRKSKKNTCVRDGRGQASEVGDGNGDSGLSGGDQSS